ncbi:MAG: Vinculin family-domain-containing protein, partial [Olpidium bornovanus]
EKISKKLLRKEKKKKKKKKEKKTLFLDNKTPAAVLLETAPKTPTRPPSTPLAGRPAPRRAYGTSRAMRTQSNKQVIEPIAHAVAQLVLLNSDAELRNAPIPDLRQVASVVEEQVAGLVQVGSQMMQSPEADETLRKDMSAASKHVSEAARRLAAAADALAEDPYSQSARKDLSEAAKGLLAGTAGVLDAYDENEIRRIVENCRRAAELIAGLRDKLPIDKLVETVRTMCRLLVQLTKQCTVRSKELLSEQLAWRLLAAINVIERRTPLLVSACKSAALNPHNGAAVKCRDGFADEILSVCKEIERVVTTRIMEEQQEEVQSERNLAAACKEISNLLLDVRHVVASHDDENLASLVGGIRKHVDVITTVANRLADTTDQNRKQHLQAISASLQDSCELVAQAASRAAKQTGNPETERELSLSLTKARWAVKAAATAMNRAVIKDVMRGLAEIISHVAPGTQLARLYDAAVVGNRSKLDEALAVFSDAHRSVDADASFALEVSDADPVTRRAARAKASQLADLLPKLASAAQAAVVNPNEQGAWAHFSAVVGAWEETAADFEKKLIVEDGIFGVRDLAAAAKDVVDDRSQELAAALRNQDVASYEVAVAQLSAAVQCVNALHRLQAVNADDVDYRRQLEEGTSALTEGLRLLSRKFSRGQSFADAAKQASETISARVAALTSLTGRPADAEQETAPAGERPEEGWTAAAPPGENESEQKTAGGAAHAAPNNVAAEADEAALLSDADVVIVDAEEPQPLSFEEAQKNPIAVRSPPPPPPFPPSSSPLPPLLRLRFPSCGAKPQSRRFPMVGNGQRDCQPGEWHIEQAGLARGAVQVDDGGGEKGPDRGRQVHLDRRAGNLLVRRAVGRGVHGQAPQEQPREGHRTAADDRAAAEDRLRGEGVQPAQQGGRAAARRVRAEPLGSDPERRARVRVRQHPRAPGRSGAAEVPPQRVPREARGGCRRGGGVRPAPGGGVRLRQAGRVRPHAGGARRLARLAQERRPRRTSGAPRDASRPGARGPSGAAATRRTTRSRRREAVRERERERERERTNVCGGPAPGGAILRPAIGRRTKAARCRKRQTQEIFLCRFFYLFYFIFFVLFLRSIHRRVHAADLAVFEGERPVHAKKNNELYRRKKKKKKKKGKKKMPSDAPLGLLLVLPSFSFIFTETKKKK